MKENLFGIKALESCFEYLLSLHEASAGQYGQNWRDKNIQPKEGKKEESLKRRIAKETLKEKANKDGTNHTCPHYELLEFSAEIVGIKPEELASFDYFCGIIRKDVMVSGLGGRNRKVGGVEEIPFRCCSAIRYIIQRELELAKTKKPKPITQISESPSEDEKKKVQEFFEADEKFKAGQQIFNLWKKTVTKNIGTKKLKYSDNELILQVENLLKQLEKLATGKTDNITNFFDERFGRTNVPCAQTPKYERTQWLHID